jgi:hypothetical protein
MGYVGGRLEPLFRPPQIDLLCRRLALRGGREMVANVKRNTPIGAVNPFAPHIPGALRESIKQIELRVYPRLRTTVYESGAETNLDYAPYVEHGTGLHGPRRRMYQIRPKNPNGWLSWIHPETGERIFAKRVLHPGSPGNHMFEYGAHITEHEFNFWGEHEAREWCRRQEEHWSHQPPVVYGRVA